jgi:predicted O-linked N-acetylglucosamine transferase (SPINDLY family)
VVNPYAGAPSREAAAAAALHNAGRYADAVGQWELALRRTPGLPILYIMQAASLRALDRGEEAITSLEHALALHPDAYEALDGLRGLLTARGIADRAAECARRAYALRPSDRLAIQQALILPAILDSRQHILALRAQLERDIDLLLARRLSISDPLSPSGAYTGFYLAFHGENNRDLQRKIAQLWLNACPQLAWQAPHCANPQHPRGRIRIGIASSLLRAHSIGKTSRGFIARLPRDRYEVFAVNLPSSGEDELSQWMRERSDHWIRLDGPLARSRQQLADLKLDVLFWQDVGLTPYSYYLAFARLAPIQCMSFGHPDTSGIPNVDYFVSSDLFEPADAHSHYGEELALLRDLPTLAYYYRPARSADLAGQAAAARATVGRTPGEHLYLCAQSLFKLHPDFDPLLAGILRRDPLGRILLLKGYGCDAWIDALRARFRHSIPDVAHRIQFFEPLGQERFLQLLAAADVALDTPHFNGMNSSLEAFAVGTPVVTLPGQLQRGRHTQAMYRRMGLSDCIARDEEDYAAIAVRIACSSEYRAALRQSLLERNTALFEDERVIEEFCRFFEAALAARFKTPR